MLDRHAAAAAVPTPASALVSARTVRSERTHDTAQPAGSASNEDSGLVGTVGRHFSITCIVRGTVADGSTGKDVKDGT